MVKFLSSYSLHICIALITAEVLCTESEDSFSVSVGGVRFVSHWLLILCTQLQDDRIESAADGVSALSLNHCDTHIGKLLEPWLFLLGYAMD